MRRRKTQERGHDKRSHPTRARHYLREGLNLGQADLYPGLVSGPYLQHKPAFPEWAQCHRGLHQAGRRIPCEVKRVAIDGDLAFVHVRYLDWEARKPRC